MNRITMSHPKTKGTITIPESAVKIYERSGWVSKAADSDAAPKGSGKAPAKEEGK